jgi:hypothetical protein
MVEQSLSWCCKCNAIPHNHIDVLKTSSHAMCKIPPFPASLSNSSISQAHCILLLLLCAQLHLPPPLPHRPRIPEVPRASHRQTPARFPHHSKHRRIQPPLDRSRRRMGSHSLVPCPRHRRAQRTRPAIARRNLRSRVRIHQARETSGENRCQLPCDCGAAEPMALLNPRREKFEGDVFHTSRWRSDIDLNGKNVVVVGAGASAAQVVPYLLKEPYHVKSLTQAIRAAPWIMQRL